MANRVDIAALTSTLEGVSVSGETKVSRDLPYGDGSISKVP
jgi:hypothetical protein